MTNRILVTGAGGPAAISFFKAIKNLGLEVHMADMDPLAAGLYLVGRSRRAIVPEGAAADFVDCVLATCVARDIDVLVPTCDAELLTLAKHRLRFERHGVRLLLASRYTLEVCLDKWSLLQLCRGHVVIPKSTIFDDCFSPKGWAFPLIVKPRTGSGSRDIYIARNHKELARLERGNGWLVQEFLSGKEYSVDVIANAEGEVLAAVPRERTKIDSGVAVASHTVNDPTLIEAAKTVARLIGLKHVANVQFKLDEEGRPGLLEVNCRFPGTMALTVASGINMPALSLMEFFGKSIDPSELTFHEIAVVRYLEEVYLDVADMKSVPMSAPMIDEVAA